MRPYILNAFVACLACASAAVRADEICDFTVNPDARDGHTPADTNRYFTVCSSSRYEAHPSTVMLEDDRTILAFWDIQQAGPCGPAAVSRDAGRTWTRIDERIPKEFRECHAEPKAFRFADPKTGRGRIRVFASYGTADEFDWRGAEDRPLAEAMPSIVSEDDGASWRFLPPLGADFACVVGFSGMVRLKDGAYLGVFCRGTNPNGDGGDWRVMGSITRDGGLTFERPFELAAKEGQSLFMPTVFRSPDGQELCCLAGSFRDGKAWTCFSKDEGRTWSAPGRASDALAGTAHAVGVLADGRLAVAFSAGNVKGWVGPYKALRGSRGADGFAAQLFFDYSGGFSAGSPNLHVRRDGEVVAIAHSQFDLHRPMPAVVAMRFTPDEVARTVTARRQARRDFEDWKPFADTPFRPLEHAKFFGPFAQELVQDSVKEKTIRPFDGTKAYIAKVAGKAPRTLSSKNGTYDIAKRAGRITGNAAILVWTVRVPADCRARLRLVGAPSARCCVGEKTVLAATLAGIFDSRTVEIALKQGDNDIAVMVYQPKHRAAAEAGYAEKPMLVAAGLDLAGFTCVRPKKEIDFKAEEPSIDDTPDGDPAGDDMLGDVL